MAQENGWSDVDMYTRVASPDEMKEMLNSWRHDVDSYMSPGSLEQYYELPRQQAHQLGKRVFSAYQFHISGCKLFLTELIKSPVLAGCLSCDSSAAQPARSSAAQAPRIMREFLDAYRQHKQTEVYQQAEERSRKRSVEQMRLSRQIWWQMYYVAQGRRLQRSLEAGDLNDYDLDAEQMNLVSSYDGNTQRLDELRRKQLPAYRGPC